MKKSTVFIVVIWLFACFVHYGSSGHRSSQAYEVEQAGSSDSDE